VNLTDTHCHLNLNEYLDDLPEIVDRAHAAGLYRILIPAIDLASSRDVLSLAASDPILFAAVGVHPNSGSSWEEGTLDSLRELAHQSGVVAVGEIGLDYYHDSTPRDLQKEILLKQLGLASELDLPVILHVRNKNEEDRSCIEDLLSILEDWTEKEEVSFAGSGQPPGVIHSFSGNYQEGQRALAAGFYIGITGPVTFKNGAQLREVVKATDISKLLVETDGPYLAPEPFRGKRNEPAHVRYIIDKISEVKGLSFDETARQTAENAVCVFQWE
jgi:TatD DNase family protein